jgi:hypothetical protein
MKNPWEVVRGQESLSVVLGLYCVLGTAILGMLLGMFIMTGAGNFPDRVYESAAFLYLVYIAWAHISLWTCAFNTKHRAWGYVARILAGGILAAITVSLVRGYLVR